jgi:hypothetical protein
VGFFDAGSREVPPEPAPLPWDGPPENELGVGVPIQPVLAETAEAVVAVTDVAAYSTGVSFDVVVHGPPRGRGRERARASAGRFRFGVRCADGRKATDEDAAPEPGAEVPAIVLGHEGGGGEGSWHARFWLWPLPPDGPVELVCQWPDRGVDLRSVAIDGESLRTAAARNRPLWRPAAPTGGWAPAPAFSAEMLSVSSAVVGEHRDVAGPSEPPPWIAPPQGELGVPRPLERLLVHTAEVAAVLRGVVAHGTGAELTLAVRQRHGRVPFHGALADDEPLPDPPGPPAAGGGRLTVHYAGGVTVSTLDRRLASVARGAVLHGQHGHGGVRTWDERLWLGPPPPAGLVVFTFDWPDAGIAARAVEVDAAELRAP